MRRALVAVMAAGLVVAGCGSDTEKPATETPVTTKTTPPAGSGPVQAAFDSVNQSAPWYSQVTRVELDGKAVIVWTTLTESDTDTALSMCEAAYAAGESSGTDYVSVAVRTADNSTTLASRNKLANDTACQA